MEKRDFVKRIAAILLLSVLVCGAGFTVAGWFAKDAFPIRKQEATTFHSSRELTGVKRAYNVLITAYKNAQNFEKRFAFFHLGDNLFMQRSLDLFGSLYRGMHRRMIEDEESDVLLLNNGYLAFNQDYDVRYAEDGCRQVRDFSEYLSQQGIPFLFVITTAKEYEADAQFPRGAQSGYKAVEDLFAERLTEYGVPCIVSREELLAADDDLFDWFYRTDHHWNVQAGRLLAQSVAQKLQSQFGVAINPEQASAERFTSKVYPHLFLGSQGKKASTRYGGAEDFEILYPLGETRLTVRFGKEVHSGTWEQAVLNAEDLQDRPYKRSAYTAFMYGDQSSMRAENELAPNDTSLLILKHSKGNVIDAYLSLLVKSMEILDPRFYTGDIPGRIVKSRPDAVVCIVGLNDDFDWMRTAS